MSDSSNSTGSTGSSTNSWTLLSPEEAAIENVGPVDDGTESLGDVPSLSEEVAGAAVEFKPVGIPIETVLSEEGHQDYTLMPTPCILTIFVCQETSPESSEGPVPSSPSRMSPLPPSLLDPPDPDLESQPPVIHDIVTSSPSDNEHLGAMPFVTNIDMGAPLDIPTVEVPPFESEESCSAPLIIEIPISAEHELQKPVDVGLIPASPPGESQVFSAEPEVNIPTETLTATDPLSHVEADISFVPDSTESQSPVPESLVTEHPTDESPAPETVGSAEADEEAAVKNEPAKPSEPVRQDERDDEEEPSIRYDSGDAGSFDDGLRRRNVPTFEAQRPRTSDEEDEEEEVEFKLAEKKEEKPWFSLNKCIVGALVLLFLGSLFLSGFHSDLDNGDFDASDLSDAEQSQDGLSSDPQDMKELLDKLTQENQQIIQLEAQLQSKKEELDSALKALAASGDKKAEADLEKENAKLKEELSSLPELKKELETLRARVTELSQLAADQEILPAASSSAPQLEDKDGQSNQKTPGPERGRDAKQGGRLKEELHRQKVLLEESKKRLDAMKKDGGKRKQVRDHLEEIQRKLSKEVEMWGKKKPQESKWKGNKGKHNERDHYKKEERGGEKGWKHNNEGEWRDKEEKKQRKVEKEWKDKEGEWRHKDESGGRGKKEWKDKKEEDWRHKDEREQRGEKQWKDKKEQDWRHKDEREQRGEKQWKDSKEEGWRDKEEKNEKDWKPQKQNSHKEAWRKHQDEWESKKGERRMDREERRKEKPWHSRSAKNHQHQHHHQQPRHPHQHHNNDFWRDQEQKLQRNVRPQLGCTSVEDCASKEGLYPVELSEFEELLEGYLSKLERSSSESKDRFRRLTADYFEDAVFIHDRIRFSDFAEDVADILEDMVDVLEGDGKKDDDSLEEEMEEFEREALWKFAATA
ncbi:pre-B-cell leukemia transcription factor-interacting protein 1 isoform X2 [Pundamilia nyererei]|uniref:Pre-B-cell leukemia transcription factor-interacting protein 1 isoform X2 n=1 Tax=Pundamilia nyererei TaxID=303518 RepID=A0A9Y6JDZ6_9CICH|nr:PREDICTED: pre-B-cell leukemia transcription factor-interacting protein 1-like isoform X2 [Pundamilia nyererei]